MVRQCFDIDSQWSVECLYDVRTGDELDMVRDALSGAGCDGEAVRDAVRVLKDVDTGFTFTNPTERRTVMIASHATSADELYDTIQHELKHAVEHIGGSFAVDSGSETSAYLQGYIAKRMFPAVAFLVCPRCSCKC